MNFLLGKSVADHVCFCSEEAQTYCDMMFTGNGDYCYFLGDDPQNWFDARTTCRSMGGDLTSIKDVTENNYILGLLSSMVDVGE
jgi:hypothetical protein